MNDAYRGRFAPSPTGPLHFGSLVAALASCLEARGRGGAWLLRIEDVDQPRVVPGAAPGILRTLEGYGFAWDGPVLWQSQRSEAYGEALEQLRKSGLLYACACSRKEIAAAANAYAEDGAPIYPGICRGRIADPSRVRAWRLKVSDLPITFEDRLQGRISQNLEREVGDFVLRRADGLFAYQLAVTVDDEFQGITDIVRGADLLMSTPRQIWLQRCLGYRSPSYAHLPLAVNGLGEKWSKQTLAPAIDVAQAPALLLRALRFLGQDVPIELARASVAEVWQWALAHWSLSRVPRARKIREEAGNAG